MKKFILSLFVGFVGIISFGYCEDVVGLINSYEISSVSYNGQNSNYTTLISFGNVGQKIVCVSLSPNTSNVTIGMAATTDETIGEPYRVWRDWDGKYACLVKGSNQNYLLVRGGTNGGGSVNGSYFYLDELLGTDIPVMTSLECQTQYSLIPISDINSNYCEINGLCPASPELTGFGYSSFYVKNGEGNWNELSGTENYFIYLPEYLGYNYDYSNQGRDLDFTVGVGVDTGSVQSVIDINSYRPTSEDFTNVFVGGLTLIFPYIFVALLIIFIRKLVKRIFK